MNKLRMLVSAFIIALLACFNSVSAQTMQFDLHADFDDVVVWCLNKELSGSWTYHMTFHVNKKTGEVDRLHWNIKHCDLEDNEGNKYHVMDSGNDNLGAWWDFFNNINYYNVYPVDTGLEFDEADGWLDPYWPAVMPQEGSVVNTYKFIGNGEVVTMSVVRQLHIHANGEITADVVRNVYDCN